MQCYSHSTAPANSNGCQRSVVKNWETWPEILVNTAFVSYLSTGKVDTAELLSMLLSFAYLHVHIVRVMLLTTHTCTVILIEL